MTPFARIASALLLCTSFATAQAGDTTAPLQPALPFATDEGMARLARASAKADFATLANQFEAQSNIAFCGPTSAAIVLNALFAGSPGLPRDHSRLKPHDLDHLNAGLELAVPRFTQDNVIKRGHKTRAQVLGAPIVVAGKSVRSGGYQLREFDEMLRANGVQTELTVVADNLPDDAIRAALRDNLARAGDYVIVNYQREALGQRGGGHLSPLGAYDAQSDSFLILDVNPAVAGWVWIGTADLACGMRSRDVLENRGYIQIRLRANAASPSPTTEH